MMMRRLLTAAPTTSLRRRSAAAALTLPLLLAVSCSSSEKELPVTAPVTRGTVTAAVSATGSLQAITEQNLGFPTGGQLIELNIGVGQQIEPGQVLARIDDANARSDVAAAWARVDQQQATLGKVHDGNSVEAASDDFERAKAILDATKDQAEAISEANQSSVGQAERQLDADQVALDRAVQNAQAVCASSAANTSGTGSGTSPGQTGSTTSPDGTTVTQGRPGQNGAEHDNGLHTSPYIDPQAGTQPEAQPDPQSSEQTAEQACSQAQDAVEAARRQVTSSKSTLQQARQQAHVQNAAQDVAVEQARRDVAAARNAMDGAESDRPYDIDAQRAMLDQAYAELDDALEALDNTTLRAPVAGKVAAINGTVGEFVGGGSGTTGLSPGGRAPLPNASTGAVSDGSDTQNQRPGGNSFIVLSDVHTFQVVAPFEEADAAPLAPNQQVELSFDAVPGLTRTGYVAAIAPTGADIQGVTNYYVTIVLNEADPRLKDGQTAEAKVVTDRRDNVLTVPNAAVQRSGQTGVVTVQEADGTQRQVQIQLGLVGDSTTEVRSGLREGQQVVVARSQ